MKRRMKGVAIVLVFLLPGLVVPAPVRSQSLADEIQRLVLDYQKLSQFKKILHDMYDAYTVVSKGYSHIESIAKDNFNLHRVFLDGLLAVSPVVRDYAGVANIISNETAIVKECKAAKGYLLASGRFSAAELEYFNGMYTDLLNGCLHNLDELTMVISAGMMRMSDAERLSAIDRIDRDLSDKLNFLRVFNNYGAILAGQKGIDKNDLDVLGALHGTNN